MNQATQTSVIPSIERRVSLLDEDYFEDRDFGELFVEDENKIYVPQGLSWKLIKDEAGVKAHIQTPDGEVVTDRVFRYRRQSGKVVSMSQRQKKRFTIGVNPADPTCFEVYDVSGKIFYLDGAPVEGGETSFYIEDLGKSMQVPRLRLPVSPPLVLDNHRIFNLSHLRISRIGHDLGGYLDMEYACSEYDSLSPEQKEFERMILANGGVTLSYLLTPKPTEQNPKQVELTYGASICSMLDRYNKNKGSNQALARLDKFISSGRVATDLSDTFNVTIDPSRLFMDEATGHALVRAPWFPDGRKLQLLVLGHLIAKYEATSHSIFSVIANVALTQAMSFIGEKAGSPQQLADPRPASVTAPT